MVFGGKMLWNVIVMSVFDVSSW